MDNANNVPISVGDWMLTYLLMCIPVVNLVLLCIWAFGGAAPPSKANWAKASLIWLLITGLLATLLFLVVGLVAAAVASV